MSIDRWDIADGIEDGLVFRPGSGSLVEYADHEKQLAALREELARIKGISDNYYSLLVDANQSLAAAEQRNAELVELLRKARRSIDPSCAGKSLREELDAALRTKPTESGASE